MTLLNNALKNVLKKFHSLEFISSEISIFVENILSFIRFKKHKFIYKKELGIFLVTEKTQQVRFLNKIRGFNLYRNGIKKRADFIFSSYCLDKISFSEDDVVIDCGANFGDLMLKLKDYIKPKNYVAIEPNPSDFAVLRLNYNDSILTNKALGSVNTYGEFYVSTEEGGSSLVKPISFTEIINSSIITLDTLIQELNLKKIKLLKIEAEGYEPEILSGLSEMMLKKINYIAIDGGYERGVEREQTFTKLTNKLIQNNFEIVDIKFDFNRALFLNKKF